MVWEIQVPPAVTVLRCALAVKSVGSHQADLVLQGWNFVFNHVTETFMHVDSVD